MSDILFFCNFLNASKAKESICFNDYKSSDIDISSILFV